MKRSVTKCARVTLTTRKEQTQLKEAQSEAEVAWASLENSSAFMTQGSGPMPME